MEKAASAVYDDWHKDRRIPLINFTQSDEVVAQELYKALSTVVFACLSNTGLWDMASEYSRVAQEFFLLPRDVKEQYRRSDIAEGDSGGWTAIGREKFNKDRPEDYKENFNIRLKHKENFERHHKNIDNEKCWQLRDKFIEVINRVCYLIGIGLQLEDPWLIVKAHNFDRTDGNISPMRVNWYPKVDQSLLQPGQIRCGEHSDYGTVTLLYSDAPGLQVMNRATKEFMDAGYVEGGIFVNIGDLLQRWSGDKLAANKHRVLLPDVECLSEERMSVAFFAMPDVDVRIVTLDGSSKYPPVMAGEWVKKRYQATVDTVTKRL